MEGIEYPIYVKVRPGAIPFLKEMAQYYELIIFTASISEVRRDFKISNSIVC